MPRKNSFSRRGFVKGTAAAAGGLLLGRTGRAENPKGTPMDIEALKKACKGIVATQGDANFTELIHGNLWNRLIPRRAPQIVIRVKDEQDVIAAIHFARENKLKVVVRGGGHNWCQATLRNGGLLIDLSELNKVISIDVGARKAVVQPVISNRDIQKVLNPKGLAYPCGHCPQVKLSGYLLGGGMSWNQGVWGSGTESIEAIELVTAEGKLITASKDEHSEYFWAARGSGSGFFGVVTRYHLKLYPLPKAIHGSTYYYSMDDAAAVGGWLGENAAKISPARRTQPLPARSSRESQGKDRRARRQGRHGDRGGFRGFSGGGQDHAEAAGRLPAPAQMPLAFVRHSARFRANVRCVGSALARGTAQSRGGHFFKYFAGRPRESGRPSHDEMSVSDHRHSLHHFHRPERSRRSSGRGLFHELAGLRRTVDDVEGRRRRRGEQPVA